MSSASALPRIRKHEGDRHEGGRYVSSRDYHVGFLPLGGATLKLDNRVRATNAETETAAIEIESTEEVIEDGRGRQGDIGVIGDRGVRR